MEVVGYEPGLAYANLWMTFRPGDLIVTNKHNIPRVLVFESIERCFNRWLVKDTFTDSNGKNLGHQIHLISIRKHDNRTALVELKTYPLEFLKHRKELVEALSERGRKFTPLQAIHFRCYKGDARGPLLCSRDVDESEGEEEEYCRFHSITRAENLSPMTMVCINTLQQYCIKGFKK
jgi:hypothetical protein